MEATSEEFWRPGEKIQLDRDCSVETNQHPHMIKVEFIHEFLPNFARKALPSIPRPGEFVFIRNLKFQVTSISWVITDDEANNYVNAHLAFIKHCS